MSKGVGTGLFIRISNAPVYNPAGAHRDAILSSDGWNMSEWYYTRGQDQVGPVSAAQLQELAGCGDLRPTDLVWKDGMTEWIAATKLGIRFTPQSFTSAAANAPTPAASAGADNASIPYFSPTSDMNTLARTALRGFPPLGGQREDFPLAEEQLKQIAKTARLRAPILRASMLYMALFFAGLLVTVTMLALYLLISTRFGAFGGSVTAESASEYFIWVGVIGGLSLLCLVASRATYKCQLWAPIAMIVHFGLWIAYLAWDLFANYSDLGAPGGVFAIMLAAFMIPPLAFLLMSVSALTRIKAFLRRPLWTVHLFVQARF
jgi:hypothetical protein